MSGQLGNVIVAVLAIVFLCLICYFLGYMHGADK